MELWLSLVGIAVTAFVVGLSGAMMPGPLLAVAVRESARRGAMTGPLLVLGHAVLEAVLVAAVVFGMGEILRARLFVIVVSLAGGIVMCWMGWDMVRSAVRLQLKVDSSDARGLHPVAAGVVVSLSNPYWIIWWATIGAGYILTGAHFGWVGVLAFFCGHIGADLAWYTLISVGVARGRDVLPVHVYRWMVRICGVAMVFFGVCFTVNGASRMLAGS